MEWLASQEVFATFQALRFEDIMSLLRKTEQIKPEQETELRGQFSHYTENIRAAHARSERTRKEFNDAKDALGEKEAFVFIARTMGYEIPENKSE